jgi:hypothetical protein
VQLDFAVLCDAATAREGLLNILGAGVALASRPSFPGPVGLALAVSVLLDENEFGERHRVTATVRAARGGDPVAEIVGEFIAERTAEEPEGQIRAGLAFPMYGLILPREGRYEFEVRLDDELVTTLPLLALVAPE